MTTTNLLFLCAIPGLIAVGILIGIIEEISLKRRYRRFRREAKGWFLRGEVDVIMSGVTSFQDAARAIVLLEHMLQRRIAVVSNEGGKP